MKNKYGLLQKGLFPETLPPCFSTVDLKRALRGIVPEVRAKELHKRPTDYVRYNGTKHDGSRRFFGSPNPISYFYVADFVSKNWRTFDERFTASPFSVSRPREGQDTDDRPVIIPSLSELTTEASKKIGYSPFILKTDIAQFFPSIYTHSISWSAHGIERAKKDTEVSSKDLPFNRLDFLVRNCQLAETRGVLVGPDAFRLVSEFIAAGIDGELFDAVGAEIVGAARHVDDYYLGLQSETAAIVVLSKLRELLQRYNLNINDSKTKILSGLEPLNDLWAQELRQESRNLNGYNVYVTDTVDDIVLFINKALDLSATFKTDSPVKIALRTLDQIRLYRKDEWSVVEPYLQRIIFHHPHCIDYAALLVVKRVALNKKIDSEGWTAAVHHLVLRHLAFNHHHEVVWLLWLLLCCRLDIPDELVTALIASPNAHIRSLVVAGFADGRIARKPKLSLGGKLPSTDQNWLLNLQARSVGFSKASFGGSMSAEFEHLANRNVVLIDIQDHLDKVQKGSVHAISRTRYGYDRQDDDYYDFGDDDGIAF
ncbi:RNA-directed DNA polymerase [Brevundimonas sp. LPMIX5]|uniref:RNA-directed DNA polymerase n=1 Tax=Brevundimonas sp. LPMIX5 TaxID=2305887 RepID=UPI0011C3FCA9|nr:RNA-directed DNA polymerase [Brevundimonas sp. LPMIX5]